MACREGDGATIKYDDYVEHSRGRCTSIAILTEGNLAFLVVDTTFTSNLYYYVGVKNGRKITWGDSVKYTTGKNPNIALLRHERAIYVVEVHDTNFFNCHYNIWKYNKSSQQVQGSMKGKLLSAARNPKICANDAGWAVAVFHDKKYAVGQVNFKNDPRLITVFWTERELMEGSNPDVSMSGNTVVLALTRKFSVKTFVGELQQDRRQVEWGNVINVPGTGWYPSIALNREGHVLLGRQSIAGRRIDLMHGTATQYSIWWDNNSQTTGFYGEYPHIAFNGELDFFVNYKTNFGGSLLVMPGFITMTEANNEALPPQEDQDQNE